MTHFRMRQSLLRMDDYRPSPKGSERQAGLAICHHRAIDHDSYLSNLPHTCQSAQFHMASLARSPKSSLTRDPNNKSGSAVFPRDLPDSHIQNLFRGIMSLHSLHPPIVNSLSRWKSSWFHPQYDLNLSPTRTWVIWRLAGDGLSANSETAILDEHAQ
ncbi:hypothetical protein ACGC1H_006176 [Rhizoctonia solani]